MKIITTTATTRPPYNDWVSYLNKQNNLMKETVDLKMRMCKVQAQWEVKSYVPVYEAHFGELSPIEKEKVRQVWQLQSTDEVITRNFENILKILKWNDEQKQL